MTSTQANVSRANMFHLAHTYKMYREVYIMQSCLIIAFLVSYIIQGLGIRPGVSELSMKTQSFD